MGFVDGKTMIEFKEKILTKINSAVEECEEKIDKNSIDKNILSKINFEHISSLESPLFFNSTALDQGTTYSFATGMYHGHHLKNKDGNGFKPIPSDYLHYRKKYLFLYINTQDVRVRVQSLVDYLFTTSFLTFAPISTISVVNQEVPYKINVTSTSSAGISKTFRTYPKSCLLITFSKTYTEFDTQYGTSATIDSIFNDCIKTTKYINSIKNFNKERKAYSRSMYRTEMFIVENLFRREDQDEHLFCERVYAHLDLRMMFTYSSSTDENMQLLIWQI